MRDTPVLAKRRAQAPNFWFQIRDHEGESRSQGRVPLEYASIGDALDGIGPARLGWNILDGMRPTARMKWTDTPAGNIQILTGQGGAVSWRRIGHAALTLFLGLVLPIVALMTLTTFVATPVVVRQTLAGLDRAAAQAEKIDIDGRGARLPLQTCRPKSFRWYRPSMMRCTALMRVTNDTSGFLSMRRTNSVRRSLSFRRGWNRCHSAPARDACSKMLRVCRRWPISFWTCNASTSRPTGFPPSISSPSGGKSPPNLRRLRSPLVTKISFESDVEHILVRGDAGALERALTNLIQNAIEHGGRKGGIAGAG